MLELGPSGETMHRECGERMGNYRIDFVLGVRGLAKFIVDGADAANVAAEFVRLPEEAGEWLKHNVKAGDLVLLKASRGGSAGAGTGRWMGRDRRTASH